MNAIELATIAKEAAAQYDIDVASISAVARSGAAVFKVKDHRGAPYSLRIHLPGSSTLEPVWTRLDVLESELVWLEALCRDTSLTLPAPQRNRQGSYVTQVNGIHCTMLTWIPGEQKPYFTSDQELKSTAEMTATLHRHARLWEPPGTFFRPVYNVDRLRLASDMVERWMQEQSFDSHVVRVIAAAGEKAIALHESLPKNKMTWGIAHNDLLPSNIVYVNGNASPIDFSACGYSYYLNDLACTFCFVHPGSRQQYLDWYGAHFPLPNDYADQLEGLFVASQLTSMIHYLGLPDANSWLPTHVQKLASREFGRYAAGESFLFSGTPFWE